ncbi:hypothetical protein MtrunA17_Chr1g0202851 [Medicago truncatula]|uniref:Transmembrane protein n=1 Tax=Medicago truncatula TaxID=3880 RepID=A0A396JYC8_MEDTR|nr:hypothetical protein MtrunA17_Chr1g0202851 [Medicago truncatula]
MCLKMLMFSVILTWSNLSSKVNQLPLFPNVANVVLPKAAYCSEV